MRSHLLFTKQAALHWILCQFGIEREPYYSYYHILWGCSTVWFYWWRDYLNGFATILLTCFFQVKYLSISTYISWFVLLYVNTETNIYIYIYIFVPCYLGRSKGFTMRYSDWLIVIPYLAGIFKRCLYSSTFENWLWDLDYITSKQHTKLYAQIMLMHVLCKPGSTWPFAYFIANSWTVPDFYNYA